MRVAVSNFYDVVAACLGNRALPIKCSPETGCVVASDKLTLYAVAVATGVL